MLDHNGNFMYHENDILDPMGNVLAMAGDKVLEENRISAYTTPEGYSFAYQRWQLEQSAGYEKIHASTYSNIKNLPPNYIQGLLDTYPAELVDAYINGQFVNLIGKSCYPKFDRSTHDSNEEAQPNDILEIGMDFNVVFGASAIHVLRDGAPVAVDEIHNSYDTDEQIAILKDRYPKNVINIYPDATGKKRTSSNTTESDVAKLKLAKFNVFKDHANPPIKDRLSSFNAMIMNGTGDIQYKVNTKRCPNLTNALEQQVYDGNGMPDKSNGLDHITDAAGYYMFYRFGITKTKTSVRTSYNGY